MWLKISVARHSTALNYVAATDPIPVIDRRVEAALRGAAQVEAIATDSMAADFICTTCGTQFTDTDHTPVECKICNDEQQIVGWQGQQWTLEDLRQQSGTFVRLNPDNP